MDNEEKFESLIKLIEQMPPMTPPKDFTDRVMEGLQPKRLSFLKRLYRGAFTPKTVSFTPVRLIPSMVAVMALFFVFLINLDFIGLIYQQGHIVKQEHTANSTRFVPVTFALEKAGAKDVSVIGSFNGWEPGRHEMRFDKEKNEWILTIKLPPGQYEYAFMINGEKIIPDPKAAFTRFDGFGSRNSVIFTGNHSEIHL